MYVTVGSYATILTSTDGGITWQRAFGAENVGDPELRSVAYGNGTFVAAGKNAIYYKTGSGTWTKIDMPGLEFQDVIFANDIFVAVGDNALKWSADGSNWQNPDNRPNPVNGFYLGSVAADGNGHFVAVGSNKDGSGDKTGYLVWNSGNGRNWASATAPNKNGILHGVAYGSGVFMAVGGSESNSWISSDLGSNWIMSAAASGSTMNDIAYGDGVFVTEGGSSLGHFNADGSVWIADATASDFVTHVSYVNGAFVAATLDRKIYQSQTGAPVTYTIESIPNQTMTELTAGYGSGTQQTKTISITKTGTGNLTNLAAALSGTGAGSFTVTQPVTTTLDGTTTSTTFTVKAKDGLAAGTYTATVTVSADNMTNVTFTVTQVVRTAGSPPSGNNNGSGGSGSRSGSNPPPPPSYQANVSGAVDSGALPVSVSTSSNNDVITAGTLQGDSMTGGNPVVIAVPSIPGVNSFTLEIPTDYLSAPGGEGAFTLATDAGSITMPSNMLATTEGENARITISQGEPSGLPDDVKELIGNRPLIQLTLTMDGEQTEWNNPDAPVTVSVPYTPTTEELQDPEHIVVWYLDGNGNAVSIPSGRYDSVTGTVTFTTTHFSNYAVAYVHKTFADLTGTKWAKKAIEVMVSKGIINGTGKDSCSPATCITRADYMVMLIKSLGLTADFKENFADVKSGTYYYEALGIAKKLGIAAGSGDNLFRPKEKISRQDMMVLAVRALEKAKKLKTDSNTGVLDQYGDKDRISGYASTCLAALIQNGLITGSGNKLNPRGDTTRAEAAVFLYRVYNL